MRAGFFTYPWDLLDGPEQAVKIMAAEYGCNALTLNVAYHHARLLRPRSSGPKTWELPGAVAAFEPNPEHYSGPMMPVPDPGLVNLQIVQRTQEACKEHDLDLNLWVVGLHNSTLGERHRELCVRNCFGDIYTYSFCPTNPQVQAYLKGMVEDLCSQYDPLNIVLEAIGYLSLRHWVHHEFVFPAWTEPLEFLFSLCFCPFCLARADDAGVDGHALQDQVAGWLERWLRDEPARFPAESSQGEIASLLFELPELYAYLQLRNDRVSALVTDLRAVAQAADVALQVIPASFHRPASRAWLEGANLAELGRLSDGLLIPAYHDRVEEVQADLWWVRSLAPEASITVGLNPCSSSFPGASTLVAQAAACRDAGCHGVTYYNYGLLTERRLGWVGQANAALKGGSA